MLTLEHDRFLVVAVALVTAKEFNQMIIIFCSIIVLDRNVCRCRTENSTGFLCKYANTGIDCCLCFHTSSYYRGFCCKKWYCLTLHVGSHQCTVGIVVLQERNQCCSYGEYHLRRYVHVVKHALLIFLCFFTETTGYILMKEMSLFIQRLIRLSYMIVIFFICCHVYNFIRYDRICRICFIDSTIWSLNKSIFVNSCIGCKRVDQTDVRTFRCLDRAHTTIVRIVNVSNLESGSVS